MVRIKDIAEKVGVSTTTVSNVIHGKEQKVSPDVRKKIEQAIEDMGYVPNMSAMMLAQTHSGMIGVVLTQKISQKITLEDPYYSSLIGYLEYEIRRHNHYMFIIAQQSEEEILRQAAAWNLEGLIVCNMSEEQLLSLHEKYNKYIVSIDTYLNRKANFINIMTDDFGGGYAIGKYLIEKGHRKIAMVADNDYGVDHYRWMGFQKALQESGIEVNERMHLMIPADDELRVGQLEILFPEFMKYTALFFASDYYALEACSFFQSKSIRIPEDISIAGFDDLLYARMARPKLTTMRQDIGKKACMAVEGLLSLIEKEECDKKWLLHVDLVERESVKQI